jgi:hypothetical protein
MLLTVLNQLTPSIKCRFSVSGFGRMRLKIIKCLWAKKYLSNVDKFMCTRINVRGYSHNRRGSWQQCVNCLLPNSVVVLSHGVVRKNFLRHLTQFFFFSPTRSLLNAVLPATPWWRVAVYGFRVPCFILISLIFFTVLNTYHISPKFALFIQIPLFYPSVCVPHFSSTSRLTHFVSIQGEA